MMEYKRRYSRKVWARDEIFFLGCACGSGMAFIVVLAGTLI